MKFEVDQSDLSRVEKDLNEVAQQLQENFIDVGDLIKSHYIDAATFIRDSGDFINSIENHRIPASELSGRIDARELVIGSDVGYSLIIEQGRRDQNRPGEFPARRALEAFDSQDDVRKYADKAIDEALKNAGK